MSEFCVRVKFQDAERIKVIVGKLLNETDDSITIKTGAGNIIEINRKFIVTKEHTQIVFQYQTKEDRNEGC